MHMSDCLDGHFGRLDGRWQPPVLPASAGHPDTLKNVGVLGSVTCCTLWHGEIEGLKAVHEGGSRAHNQSHGLLSSGWS